MKTYFQFFPPNIEYSMQAGAASLSSVCRKKNRTDCVGYDKRHRVSSLLSRIPGGSAQCRYKYVYLVQVAYRYQSCQNERAVGRSSQESSQVASCRVNSGKSKNPNTKSYLLHTVAYSILPCVVQHQSELSSLFFYSVRKILKPHLCDLLHPL
jgi:hypothetical protein